MQSVTYVAQMQTYSRINLASKASLQECSKGKTAQVGDPAYDTAECFYCFLSKIFRQKNFQMCHRLYILCSSCLNLDVNMLLRNNENVQGSIK